MENGEIKVEVSDSDPEKFNGLFVGLSAGVEGGSNKIVGYQTEAIYFYKNKFNFKVSVFSPLMKSFDNNRSVYDRLDFERNGNPIYTFNKTEVGQCYYFLKKNVLKVLRFNPDWNSNFVRVVYRAEFPVQRRRGFRVGLCHQQQSLMWGAYLVDRENFYFPVYASSLSKNSVYIGISAGTFRHMKLKIRDHDPELNAKARNLYADILIDLTSKVNYFSYYPYSIYKPTTPSIPLKTGLGYRVGYECVFNTSVNHLAVKISVEVGSDMAKGIKVLGPEVNSAVLTYLPDSLKRFPVYFSAKLGLFYFKWSRT